MRKIKVAAALAITCTALGAPRPASAQHLLGDFDAFDALSRILAGDGLTAKQTGDALYYRLSNIRGDLNAIKYGGVDDTEAAEYQELYTDGLAVLDRMEAEVAGSGGSAEEIRAAEEIVADWRADFVQSYGGQAGTAREGTDHARICDAFGSNYYYIPGTETCLRINGNVRGGISWLENTHELGSGTVVTNGGGEGNENFGARFGDWIQRDGISLDVRLSGDFGDASIGKFPITGVYGGYEGAWGDAGYSGNATIGQDGVTGVGYTYFEPDGAPGAIANADGFGLETRGDLSNSWNRINLGVKVALPIGDDDTGPRVRGRIGGFYEDLVTKASGSAQLTYYGAPYAGFSQDWHMLAKDRYAGLRVGTHIGFQPQLGGKLKTSVGGDLYLGYHSGEGSYLQHSLTSGTPIDQVVDYSKNGFAVGAALTASASYEFAEGWKLGGQVEWSSLPSVTSFKAPQNPNEQADAGFALQRAARLILRAGVSRSF